MILVDYQEGQEGKGVQIDELRSSIERYAEARRRIASCLEILEIESERMFRSFMVYAKSRREEDKVDLNILLNEFYTDVLDLSREARSRGIRSSLTKRFKKIARKYMTSDPKYQRRIDEFIQI